MVIKIADSTAGAGSRDASIVMSGCKLIDFDAPSTSEGINEWTLTIHPKNAIVSVDDTTQLYNPW